MSHEEGRIKATRPNEFTRRTHRRTYGEEGQGQILGENLYLKLEKKRRRRNNGENKRGVFIIREDKGGENFSGVGAG